MLFGTKELKPLEKELKRTKADMKAVKEWMKLYKKVKKNYPKVKNNYDGERAKLEHLQDILKHMEACFIAGGDVKKALSKDVAQLNSIKDFAGHEFLVDQGNAEFALTFSRLKKMTGALKKVSEEEMLFLHSETENLSDMTKEILGKEKPDLHRLTFFMLTQSEEQLKEMPYESKIEKVGQVYKRGFLEPMENVLSEAILKADENMVILSMEKDKTMEERIDYIMEEWIWKS